MFVLLTDSNGCFVMAQSTKLKLLAGAAFFEGASVGTLVDAVLKFNPRYAQSIEYVLLGYFLM